MAMAEEFQIADTFSLDLQWPANPGKGGNLLLDGSIARFQMMVGDKSITAYQTEKGDKNTYLTIPLYYLVEWLALNWWSFLYEPRKLEGEAAEQDFRSRHWLGIARNGFPLPDVTFSPAGDKIEIVARSAFLRFVQLNFIESVAASAETDNVRSEFSALVEQVLARLSEKGVTNSAAHVAWRRVKETSAEEEVYCRLIGSLGSSPYLSHPEIDNVMEEIGGKISNSMLIDLCDATNVGNFNRAAKLADVISQALAEAKPARLDDLLKASKPADTSPRAYEWGYHATDAARSALGIAHDDPAGSAAFFERLQFDPSFGIEVSSEAANISLISGAVEREDGVTQVSLTGANRGHRKFAAARASFLAWTGAKESSRLVTTARTRDQQASRAFAAELLAPAKYLSKRLGDRSSGVSPFTLDKLSEEMGIASAVVHYQARNHGYYIAEAA
jgi:hypothetical protein